MNYANGENGENKEVRENLCIVCKELKPTSNKQMGCNCITPLCNACWNRIEKCIYCRSRFSSNDHKTPFYRSFYSSYSTTYPYTSNYYTLGSRNGSRNGNGGRLRLRGRRHAILRRNNVNNQNDGNNVERRRSRNYPLLAYSASHIERLRREEMGEDYPNNGYSGDETEEMEYDDGELNNENLNNVERGGRDDDDENERGESEIERMERFVSFQRSIYEFTTIFSFTSPLRSTNQNEENERGRRLNNVKKIVAYFTLFGLFGYWYTQLVGNLLK